MNIYKSKYKITKEKFVQELKDWEERTGGSIDDLHDPNYGHMTWCRSCGGSCTMKNILHSVLSTNEKDAKPLCYLCQKKDTQ